MAFCCICICFVLICLFHFNYITKKKKKLQTELLELTLFTCVEHLDEMGMLDLIHLHVYIEYMDKDIHIDLFSLFFCLFGMSFYQYGKKS